MGPKGMKSFTKIPDVKMMGSVLEPSDEFSAAIDLEEAAQARGREGRRLKFDAVVGPEKRSELRRPEPS